MAPFTFFATPSWRALLDNSSIFASLVSLKKMRGTFSMAGEGGIFDSRVSINLPLQAYLFSRLPGSPLFLLSVTLNHHFFVPAFFERCEGMIEISDTHFLYVFVCSR
jgi:hypothetical protein